ncbi:MAG TPA: methyltransferase domain-containing protein [Actinomycetes bacterium]|nr:methyltransferase domain-containing protein [Actinomycetes bacterium]
MHPATTQPSPREERTSTTQSSDTAWAHAFAVLYDPFLWAGERLGVRTLRAEQLSHARGRTVEIGGGTGLNLPHYPDDLHELAIVEPDAAMRTRLERRLRRRDERPVRVLDGHAELLPFGDRSVDTVVSTFVLCTVDAPDLALREIARVLRPGGELLFIEHVRSDSPTLARWQDLAARPWRRFAQGCRCNRSTGELLATCGLEPGEVRQATWRGMPPILRPLIAGRARKPG